MNTSRSAGSTGIHVYAGLISLRRLWWFRCFGCRYFIPSSFAVTAPTTRSYVHGRGVWFVLAARLEVGDLISDFRHDCVGWMRFNCTDCFSSLPQRFGRQWFHGG
ncbi:unnamed protein product [Laminaria digitata]